MLAKEFLRDFESSLFVQFCTVCIHCMNWVNSGKGCPITTAPQCQCHCQSDIYIVPIVRGRIWGAGAWVTSLDRPKRKGWDLRRDLKVARLSDERICRGREFQLLGEDTQIHSSRGQRRYSTGRNSKKVTISTSQTSRWPICQIC